MSSTGNGVSGATNAIGLGGNASSLDTDGRAGAPTSQVVHDIGDSLDKAQSYLNRMQTIVNNSTDATGSVVGQSAQISADMQLAQQAQQQYLTDTDSPL